MIVSELELKQQLISDITEQIPIRYISDVLSDIIDYVGMPHENGLSDLYVNLAFDIHIADIEQLRYDLVYVSVPEIHQVGKDFDFRIPIKLMLVDVINVDEELIRTTIRENLVSSSIPKAWAEILKAHHRLGVLIE